MSAREVIFLGTASQVPTRHRNHNALFLRWDELGILFDPGEGTQRQLLIAGVAATQITHICITHFHGDHCLGLAALASHLGFGEGLANMLMIGLLVMAVVAAIGFFMRKRAMAAQQPALAGSGGMHYAGNDVAENTQAQRRVEVPMPAAATGTGIGAGIAASRSFASAKIGRAHV